MAQSPFDISGKGKVDLDAAKAKTKSMAKWVIIGILTIIILVETLGVNDAGQRTVVQYPTGSISVKFDPGVYIKGFGKTTTYPDVITYDYDNTATTEGSIVDNGVGVQYQDGGLGTTFGKNRFRLPTDEQTMIKIHKEFRSSEGLANRLLRPVVKETHQLTAALMTSEAAYAEKKSQYIQYIQDQISNGKYLTELTTVQVKNDAGDVETKQVPVIRLDDKKIPMHGANPIGEYGITISSSQITNWDFEDKTKAQIAKKREAMMAIITSRAEAEKARQDALTAEDKGKADVMKEKYAQLEAAQKDIVEAEKLVEIAKRQKLEAEQKKLAAAEYKQEQILRGQGDAERKRLVMQADGALEQKLAAYKEVNFKYAEEFGKQKWVPEIQFGATGGNANSANTFLEMLQVKAARDLSLDMSIKGGKPATK